MKIRKDNILICIQERTPLSYDVVRKIYDITKSYDMILELNDMSLKFNQDIVELATYLYKNKNE